MKGRGQIKMNPKYEDLLNIIKDKIQNGTYPLDSRLPTEMELSAYYHLSRQTVRKALSLLVKAGLISKKQGSGSVVVSTGVKQDQRCIAIIASHTSDYIYPVVLQDIQTVLLQNNFSFEVFTTYNKISLERDALQTILNNSFAGVLAEGVKTALPNPNLALYKRLKKKNTPIVFFHGGYTELEDAVCVTDDNYIGGYQLTRYLISKGHTRIGGIFKSDDIQGRQRYQGYVTALCDANIRVPDENLLWFSTEDRDKLLEGHDLGLLQNYVKSRLEGCTALVVYNDEIAYYLILVLQEVGYDIPGNISVVSFDNSFYCSFSPVQITSLGHKGEQTGTVAANLLLRIISEKNAASVVIPWKLIERQSG